MEHKLSEGRMLSTSNMIKIALLAVISYLVMFIEFPLPFFPPFLKIDFSDLPALIGGFAISPIAGVLIELIKNLLHFVFQTSTGGVGELANFVIGSALIFPAAVIYHMNKSKKNAIYGLIVGSITMGIVGGLANYYVLLPFYSKFMPLEVIVSSAAALNNMITDMNSLIIYGIVPFNIIKALIVSVVTLSIYKKVSVILHK
jgi:riboflavin transporter FmnP